MWGVCTFMHSFFMYRRDFISCVGLTCFSFSESNEDLQNHIKQKETIRISNLLEGGIYTGGSGKEGI